ncbi:hypothetical protein WN944_026980 [Citrus x changshan-huyou]|uniref:glucan endo-1,3-beta-D-glucosidase n=1 Tax=Citrus x changshan-huyou TaxID=2935761 RepID=A0AAP0LH35_9ROSI
MRHRLYYMDGIKYMGSILVSLSSLLFDAQIDAVFAALFALKYDDIRMVVTETGWPSKGTRMRLVQASKTLLRTMEISIAEIEEQQGSGGNNLTSSVFN